MKQAEPPEGIILTVSAKMIGDNGYRHWLRNFLEAMDKSSKDEDWFYWFRAANKPKAEYRDHLRYVYLCIGGKIRYRVFFAAVHGPLECQFSNRDKPLFGKAWILTAGPVERAPYVIKKQGFQGFRYTHKLF